MKLKSLLIVAMGLALGVASCKKDEKTDPTNTNNNNNNNTNNTSASPTPPTPIPSGSAISGALISIRMKYSSQPAGVPIPVDVNSEMALAVFYDAAGSTTMTDAGEVSVNTYKLDKQTNNSYLKSANIGTDPKDLKFTSTSDWKVGGSSSVAAFTYNHSSTFPNYTETLPSSITKSSGLSLTFNTSTVTNADSVYVVIASGDKSLTKAYAAKAGSVTITANDLQDIPTNSYNTAVLEVCPIDYMEGVANGKNYIFIKELAVAKNITIN